MMLLAGKVEGVLWYFPFENDEETVPLDPHTLGRMTLSSHKDGASQPPGHGPLTQMAQSQLPQMAASQRSRASPEQDASKHCRCLGHNSPYCCLSRVL